LVDVVSQRARKELAMINWGLIGAGGIAHVFANGMRFSKTGQVVAVASQSPGKADRLADVFSIPKRYAGYDALLADREVEAVYISTIHPFHAECAVKAAQAGKHILVEKPIAMNYREALSMLDAARANDVFLMEAFMYRCHPQTSKLAELVGSGAIGRVQVIRAVFSYGSSFDPTSRAYAKEMGGGGILDVGCYTASMARLLAGAALGKRFAEPLQVKGCATLGPTGVDHYAAATVQFEGGILAELITGVGCQMPTEVSVYGEGGSLSVSNPWLPSSPCRSATEPLPPDTRFPPATITLRSYRSPELQPVVVEADRDLFTYEADMVAAHIADRQAPAMSWDDTLGNMWLLDRWRQEVGLVYEQDRPAGE
jgi:predicted dehydrogenase